MLKKINSNNNDLIPGPLLVFLFTCFIALLAIGDNNTSYAGTPEKASGNNHKVAFYDCIESGNQTVRCNPQDNKIVSYEINGNSTRIYNITREPMFIDSIRDKALQMHASYLESIKFADDRVNPEQFSISFWIKWIPDEENSYGHVISHSSPYTKQGWHIDMSGMPDGSSETVNLEIYNSNGDLFRSTEVAVPPNTFTHVVGTFDGSTIRIFKDGILHGTTKFNGYVTDPEVPLKIGAGAYCVTCNMWSGIIDDFQYYNKSLTENEVKDIFYNRTASDNLTPSLIGHWTFDGSLNDISGYDNHGIMITLLGSMVFTPDGRLLFTEKNTGKIMVMKDNKVFEEPFAEISDFYVNWEQGLLGLAIDPDYEHNHFVYLYYTYADNKTGAPFNRLVRFADIDNKATGEVTLIDRIPASEGFHTGGGLAFGKDDKLYITVGDMASEKPFQQDPSNLLGKILRINRDGTIPSDNPFPKSPVYNIGHRNMYGIAFDNDGFGIVTENGGALYDEINSVEKGGNYGFPTFQPLNKPPELSNSSLSIIPLRSYWDVIAPTQAIFYGGDKIPDLKDKFLFGTVEGDIYALNIDNNTKQVEEEQVLLKNYEDVISLAESPSGDLYYGGYGIYQLNSINASSKKQISFPVEVASSSPQLNLEYFQVYPDLNKMIVAIGPTNHTDSKSNRPSTFAIQIPRELAGEISAVSIVDKIHEKEWDLKRESDFTVSRSGLNYTLVTVVVPNNVSSSIQEAKGLTTESIQPSISIINPQYGATIPLLPANITVIVNGSAIDSESGIQKVEAFVDTFPFGDAFPYKESRPVAPGNWSEWSIPLNLTTGYNRIIAKATDNVGNENWDEITLTILGQGETATMESSEQQKSRIAIVRPTFTDTAYTTIGNNASAFYHRGNREILMDPEEFTFYTKYNLTRPRVDVATDLDLIRDIKILPGNATQYDSETGLDAKLGSLDTDGKGYLIPFTEHVKKFAPNGTVVLISDEDVHDGNIFYDDGSNVYDVIFLLHNEYVTQAEYDNLKRYVSNGGTVVFIDSNVFYAEVLYDKNKDTITLVRGHDWEFDGKIATRSIPERWYNETRQWVGGNFLLNDIQDKVYFTNNPFNYTHFEENFVNNPNATILLNYGARFPPEYPYENHRNSTIATYELNYGRGKVIMMGIYSRLLGDNEAFLEFFDKTILPRAFATK
jgi:glucose/arabinose dehydrogenase